MLPRTGLRSARSALKTISLYQALKSSLCGVNPLLLLAIAPQPTREPDPGSGREDRPPGQQQDLVRHAAEHRLEPPAALVAAHEDRVARVRVRRRHQP